MPVADLLPPELTALRAAGLIVAAAIIAFAITRRRSLRNVDVLILLAAGAGLAIVTGTELTDRCSRLSPSSVATAVASSVSPCSRSSSSS